MRAYMRACGRACGRVCACAHTCACAYPRVYARRRVRMGACAYMRGYGTVSGGGMRLSDVAWNWDIGNFCVVFGGFDTPKNASVSKGLCGMYLYPICVPKW